MFELKRLADSQLLTAAAAAVVTNATGETTSVRQITLHNTDSSSRVVEMYRVPDAAGAVGVAADANKFYRQVLAPNETQILEWGTGMILEDQNDTIQAVCDVTSKVVISVDGGVE